LLTLCPVDKSFPTLEEARNFVAGIEIPSPDDEDKFYAVAVGHKPGIYATWDQARAQVTDCKGPKYKKFPTLEEALTYMEAYGHEAEKLNGTLDGPAKKKTKVDSTTRKDTALLRDLEEESKAVATSSSKPESDDKIAVVYTDGSSLGNGQNGALAGYGVFFGVGDERNVSEPLPGLRQTNQRAELMAILRALEIVDTNQELRITTDSKYSIDCCTSWFRGWEKNNWQTAQKTPVENKDLVQSIVAKIRERKAQGAKTHFLWIKGHSKNPGNEAADQLAVSGAQKGRLR
jgi:ribonuclease HI